MAHATVAPTVIDIRLVRTQPDVVKAALGRRGVEAAVVDRLAELDRRNRELTSERDDVRARVKALSKDVSLAQRASDSAKAQLLRDESRELGSRERELDDEATGVAAALRDL